MQQFSMVNGRRVINVYSKHFARRFNPEWMRLDNQAVRVAMRRGVGEFFRSAGKEKAVIGLSGGLDSSVSAQMVVESLGRDNVVGVAMPYGEEFTKTTDWLYASMLASRLGIEFRTEPITKQTDETALGRGIDPYSQDLSEAENNRLGNIKARQRMVVLYDVSAEVDGLVIGNSNKSERMVGYATIWGDTACAVNPLGEIYKTQEFEFARFIGVPQPIIDRPPTAALIAGQTDEGQLGFRYSELDPLCFLKFDQEAFHGQLSWFGFTKRFVARVLRMHEVSGFKRKMPGIISLPEPREEVRW